MWLFASKAGIHQKPFVVRTNLNETVKMVSDIRGKKTSTSDVAFHLSRADNSGFRISNESQRSLNIPFGLS